MTRIERIFADPIRANPLNPRHPRAILILHYTGGNSMHRLHLLLCGLCLLLAGLPATALAQDAPAVFHDSRDDAFRTPGGAQPFGGQVTLRLHTPADAAADVAVVATNLAGDAVVTLPMQPGRHGRRRGLVGGDAGARRRPRRLELPVPPDAGRRARLLRRRRPQGWRPRCTLHRAAARRPGLGHLCLRPGLHRAGVGGQRHHLPDLPRPLPQRRPGQRPDRRQTGSTRRSAAARRAR
jgi:hypothetical protein